MGKLTVRRVWRLKHKHFPPVQFERNLSKRAVNPAEYEQSLCVCVCVPERN